MVNAMLAWDSEATDAAVDLPEVERTELKAFISDYRP